LSILKRRGLEGTLHDNRRMVSRVAAFVIWAAVAASAVFWTLRLGTKPIAVPDHATVVSTSSAFNGDLGRLFGPDAQPPTAGVEALAPAPADSRFRLIGVVAPRRASANAEGLALIATDGQPAKAYRVGTPVDGELVLLSVHSRGASLGPPGQPPQLALELPVLPPPRTGTLPGSASALPRAPMSMVPRPPQPLQAVPVPPAQLPQEAPDQEPEPGSRPTEMPPTGARRPPA
jgi:general secretion pathway protein C